MVGRPFVAKRCAACAVGIGPNSNTFMAWIARRVPELGLDLPSTAIGKDYLGPTTLLAPAPSGTGWQLSVLGLAGATVARSEGLELSLLGLSVGIDLDDRRLRLPGVGFWPGNTGTMNAAPWADTPRALP